MENIIIILLNIIFSFIGYSIANKMNYYDIHYNCTILTHIITTLFCILLICFINLNLVYKVPLYLDIIQTCLIISSYVILFFHIKKASIKI